MEVITNGGDDIWGDDTWWGWHIWRRWHMGDNIWRRCHMVVMTYYGGDIWWWWHTSELNRDTIIVYIKTHHIWVAWMKWFINYVDGISNVDQCGHVDVGILLRLNSKHDQSVIVLPHHHHDPRLSWTVTITEYLSIITSVACPLLIIPQWSICSLLINNVY